MLLLLFIPLVRDEYKLYYDMELAGGSALQTPLSRTHAENTYNLSTTTRTCPPTMLP